MEFVDLHVHSIASNGSCQPYELVDMALEKGLYAFALTDMDTVEGIPYALEAAEDQPVHVIPGIEISASYQGREIHLLGYNIDWQNDLLTDTLEQVSRLRTERIMKMCDLLGEHRIRISLEELYEFTGRPVITRNDIAELMVKKRYVRSTDEAFEKYIGADCSCYLPRFKLDIEDAVKLIRYAGGVCSVAHPVYYDMTDDEFIDMFRYLKRLGVRCIEAIHSDNSKEDAERFTGLAEYVGMSITGGSDFHGDSRPDVFMGTGKGDLMIPRSLLTGIGL